MSDVLCLCCFVAENDPLQLRPNPENLLSKVSHCNHKVCLVLKSKYHNPDQSYSLFPVYDYIHTVWLIFSIFASPINQLSESEESEDEAETKAASNKKAAHSSGRKYVPPKIAPVHYGKVVYPFTAFCFFAWHKKFKLFLMEYIKFFCWVFVFKLFSAVSSCSLFVLQTVTWPRRTGRRLRQNVSGGQHWEAPWSRNWDSSTVTPPRRSGTDETSRAIGRAARRYTGRHMKTGCWCREVQGERLVKWKE